MPTSARASYKKLSGQLQLTDSLLQWTQDGKSVPAVRVPNTRAASLFCSKDGAPHVRLKLGLLDDDAGHNFTFTAPPPTAYAERERFKNELTAIISRNRTAHEPHNPVPTPTPLSLSTPNPAPVPLPAPPAISRAPSISTDPRSTPVIQGIHPATDFQLRKKVLLNNPDLAALHRELVITGQISEAEFWDGREHLLLAQAAAENQKKGKPGQLVDPRPEAVEGGEIKIKITPQLVHDIFDEYPVVAKAYSENVPKKLTEEGFWKRYFQSKLFNAHRASIRSSAVQHVVKDDPIFDKYLEKDDDGLQPRRQRDDTVDIFVDLSATQEDHDMTGNEKDATMQAGRQKGVLPLIRKFNEHSERLLNSALGDVPAAKRRRLENSDDIYSHIDLDDLYDQEASTGIVLEMQDRERYFEGRMSNAALEVMQTLDIPIVIRKAKESIESWQNDLTQLKLERKPGDAALLSMTQNVAARLDVRSRKNLFPDGFLRQMTTCQTAANEFLRQFWSAMYPPPADLPTVMVTTPAQRMAKATRMIGYISKTHEKVDALVKTAQAHGIDPSQVKIALNPILNAVDHALAFYHRKTSRS